MDVIQFSTAAARLAYKNKPVPAKPPEQKQNRINRVQETINKANRKILETGKRKDVIGAVINMAFNVSYLILNSKNIEIVDAHTLKLDRQTVTIIKHLKEAAEELNALCGPDLSWNSNFSAGLLSDLYSAVIEDVFTTEPYKCKHKYK